MENYSTDRDSIEKMVLDLKTKRLLDVHKKEYQKMLLRRKMKFVSLSVFSVGVLLLSSIYVYKNYLGKETVENQQVLASSAQPEQDNEVSFTLDNVDTFVIKESTVNRDSMPKVSVRKTENQQKQQKTQSANSQVVDDQTINSGVSQNPENQGSGNKCKGKFEDFGIDASAGDEGVELFFTNAESQVSIKQIKMNDVIISLPKKEISTGRYTIEISDNNECTYYKILKIN
jgi:hypothetical protein